MTTPPWRARRWIPVDSWSRGPSEAVRGRYNTCAIAYAACAAASRFRYICQDASPAEYLLHKMPRFWIQSSLESPEHGRMRCRRLPDPGPIPEGVREPICLRKKCAIWTRWRPVPAKNFNYPRAPSSRRSGLVGPHTTPPIVNYKYMTSTPREGYFWPPTLGT